MTVQIDLNKKGSESDANEMAASCF